MPPRKQLLPRLLWFYLGISLGALGTALIITPGLGAAPWDIFHLGIVKQTSVSLGLVIQLAGAAIILLDMVLGIRPTVGMILNMLSFGPILQFFLDQLLLPESLLGRWLMVAAGILVGGLGTALYVSAGLGSGPRDGLMIGLTRRLGLPIGLVRNGIDLTVALNGWWLGGPLGVGTVVVALAFGPCVQFGMKAMATLAGHSPFQRFVTPVNLKRT